MDADAERGRHCLALLREVIPYQYAHWLIEEPESHDYRVVASIIPEDESGYDVAHRTGVIGQVFRTEKPIVVPDVRHHQLYDPFDATIDWELCFPVFAGGKMAAVVNFEGMGTLELGHELWQRLCEVVQASAQYRPSSATPEADNSWRVETRRVVINARYDDEPQSTVVATARAIARGGESALLVGCYPELLRDRGPTMAEAEQQGLGVSYCYFGLEPRLDLLATGPISQEALLENKMGWWDNCAGRYAFVLL